MDGCPFDPFSHGVKFYQIFVCFFVQCKTWTKRNDESTRTNTTVVDRKYGMKVNGITWYFRRKRGRLDECGESEQAGVQGNAQRRLLYNTRSDCNIKIMKSKRRKSKWVYDFWRVRQIVMEVVTRSSWMKTSKQKATTVC